MRGARCCDDKVNGSGDGDDEQERIDELAIMIAGDDDRFVPRHVF